MSKKASAGKTKAKAKKAPTVGGARPGAGRKKFDRVKILLPISPAALAELDKRVDALARKTTGQVGRSDVVEAWLGHPAKKEG